jgi:hypothetical protein
MDPYMACYRCQYHVKPGGEGIGILELWGEYSTLDGEENLLGYHYCSLPGCVFENIRLALKEKGIVC